jgi:long-chain fatty acid transport protein
VVSVLGGTFKDQEVVNELNVRDMFIPRASASFVLNPWDRFDLYGVAMYQGDINAKGFTDLTANGISGAPRQNCSQFKAGDPEAGTHCRINGAELTVPLPTWEVTGGLRYAQRRVARERVLDPMKDEVFDIELNATWSQTSHVDAFNVHLHDVDPPPPGEVTYPTPPKVQFANSASGASSLYVKKDTAIPKQWKDTWTFRAGADWNVVPETLTLRLGGSFATRAVDPAYMNIDYFPVQKIGAHIGGTLALGKYRMTLAYAHFFQEEITVPVGTGMVKDLVTINEPMANAVNEGKFWSSLDVFSLQLSAGF